MDVLLSLLSVSPPELLGLLWSAVSLLGEVSGFASYLAALVKRVIARLPEGRFKAAVVAFAWLLDWIAVNSKRVKDDARLKKLQDELRDRDRRLYNQQETLGEYQRKLSTAERELAVMRRVMRIADAQPDNDNGPSNAGEAS